MPISYSAKRALRKEKRRTIVNKRIKNIMRLAMRAVNESKAMEALPKAYQAIDRATKRNLLHKKKASRLKSQLSKVVEITPQPKKKVASKAKTAKKK